VEPKKDVYDFRFLEECIGRAEKAGLKVVLYFGCSNYAAGDPVFVPDYIKNDEKTYTQVKGRGFRDEPIAGHTALALCPGNPATLERERKAYCELMAYLRDCDVNRSVLAVHYGGEMNFIQSAKEGFIGWNNPELRCECEHLPAA